MFVGNGAIAGRMGGKNDGCSRCPLMQGSLLRGMEAICPLLHPTWSVTSAREFTCFCYCVDTINCPMTMPFGKLLHLPLLLLWCSLSCAILFISLLLFSLEPALLLACLFLIFFALQLL